MRSKKLHDERNTFFRKVEGKDSALGDNIVLRSYGSDFESLDQSSYLSVTVMNAVLIARLSHRCPKTGRKVMFFINILRPLNTPLGLDYEPLYWPGRWSIMRTNFPANESDDAKKDVQISRPSRQGSINGMLTDVYSLLQRQELDYTGCLFLVDLCQTLVARDEGTNFWSVEDSSIEIRGEMSYTSMAFSCEICGALYRRAGSFKYVPLSITRDQFGANLVTA